MKKKIILVADYKFKKRWFTGLAFSYLRAFRAKGFDCKLLEFEVNNYIYTILEKYSPSKLKAYLNLKQKKIIHYVINSETEHVFVIKGYYLLPETIKLLQDYGKKVFCFYPDNPFSEIRGSSNDCITKSVRIYDCYFTWNKRLIPLIKNAGCKHVFYLPFGADTELFNTMRLGSKDEHYDLSFIGNVDEERTDFINSLSSSLDDGITKMVFGSGWKNLKGFKVKGEIVGYKFVRTILNSKINLNILRIQNKNSSNMRTFEIPAVGGFMLHEYSEEAVEFFEPGVEADYFKDTEDCADKIKYYLKNEMVRQKIAKAGHEKIFSAKHLYTDRVDDIWQKVNSIS